MRAGSLCVGLPGNRKGAVTVVPGERGFDVELHDYALDNADERFCPGPSPTQPPRVLATRLRFEPLILQRPGSPAAAVIGVEAGGELSLATFRPDGDLNGVAWQRVGLSSIQPPSGAWVGETVVVAGQPDAESTVIVTGDGGEPVVLRGEARGRPIVMATDGGFVVLARFEDGSLRAARGDEDGRVKDEWEVVVEGVEHDPGLVATPDGVRVLAVGAEESILLWPQDGEWLAIPVGATGTAIKPRMARGGGTGGRGRPPKNGNGKTPGGSGSTPHPTTTLVPTNLLSVSVDGAVDAVWDVEGGESVHANVHLTNTSTDPVDIVTARAFWCDMGGYCLFVDETITNRSGSIYGAAQHLAAGASGSGSAGEGYSSPLAYMLLGLTALGPQKATPPNSTTNFTRAFHELFAQAALPTTISTTYPPELSGVHRGSPPALSTDAPVVIGLQEPLDAFVNTNGQMIVPVVGQILNCGDTVRIDSWRVTITDAGQPRLRREPAPGLPRPSRDDRLPDLLLVRRGRLLLLRLPRARRI